jgi:hypothetical protein
MQLNLEVSTEDLPLRFVYRLGTISPILQTDFYVLLTIPNILRNYPQVLSKKCFMSLN